MKVFFAEFIGTFILSTSLNFMTDYSNDSQKVNLVEVIIGFFIGLQFSRKISGGHLNPAVTLVFYLWETEKNKKKLREVFKEMLLGQICGALLSPFLSNLLIGHSLVLKISTDSNYLGAFIMELLGATVFYLLVLFQASPKHNLTAGDEVISSLVICVGLASGISLAGNESGAGLNPAISLSQNIMTLIYTSNIGALKYTLIYILAPIGASYLASSLYDILNEEPPANPFLEENREQELNELNQKNIEMDNKDEKLL
mmetsp:Transcript_10603/g.10976  ORF Transcript_10603/g.10976 Transcript_10603/m.10976 type:complete len:257 (+) Transcript_10603:1-771(+)|eukprot:CAMPEP_0170536956 /NCGR_PEP_ID=MMETSP0209-20121228/102438_1 /TAXON_ID=665100 ORGANISM="Litonotus pictus, Strain P1" /NCGR_SAMPLE_ID=MMETSP0209 /ASSEMBLY_ACC=CAM_ASM_000301 /LENGTH=256 /DNA_ID=CAMNT_0010838383 /DNA_START=1 /DNA_END=771 /DNA_ORIENTATION=+